MQPNLLGSFERVELMRIPPSQPMTFIAAEIDPGDISKLANEASPCSPDTEIWLGKDEISRLICDSPSKQEEKL